MSTIPSYSGRNTAVSVRPYLFHLFEVVPPDYALRVRSKGHVERKNIRGLDYIRCRGP